MFNSAHAERTTLTARISSDVSITTMGVDELIRTFNRSSASLIDSSFREAIDVSRIQKGTAAQYLCHSESG
jgi:hypothetical protein